MLEIKLYHNVCFFFFFEAFSSCCLIALQAFLLSMLLWRDDGGAASSTHSTTPGGIITAIFRVSTCVGKSVQLLPVDVQQFKNIYRPPAFTCAFISSVQLFLFLSVWNQDSARQRPCEGHWTWLKSTGTDRRAESC